MRGKEGLGVVNGSAETEGVEGGGILDVCKGVFDESYVIDLAEEKMWEPPERFCRVLLEGRVLGQLWGSEREGRKRSKKKRAWMIKKRVIPLGINHREGVVFNKGIQELKAKVRSKGGGSGHKKKGVRGKRWGSRGEFICENSPRGQGIRKTGELFVAC